MNKITKALSHITETRDEVSLTIGKEGEIRYQKDDTNHKDQILELREILSPIDGEETNVIISSKLVPNNVNRNVGNNKQCNNIMKHEFRNLKCFI